MAMKYRPLKKYGRVKMPSEKKYVLVGVTAADGKEGVGEGVIEITHMLIHDTYDHCKDVASMQNFSQSRYLKVYIQPADEFFKIATLLS